MPIYCLTNVWLVKPFSEVCLIRSGGRVREGFVARCVYLTHLCTHRKTVQCGKELKHIRSQLCTVGLMMMMIDDSSLCAVCVKNFTYITPFVSYDR